MQSIEWRPVVGYEGLDEVSSAGQVRSLDHVTVSSIGRARHFKGRPIRSNPNNHGYLQVQLFKAGSGKSFGIHRLVAMAFVRGERPDYDICHNDGNKLNNAASNLRWDTKASNAQDALRHGTNPQRSKTACPKGHPYAGDNLIITRRGMRQCKTCKRDWMREFHKRKKQEWQS